MFTFVLLPVLMSLLHASASLSVYASSTFEARAVYPGGWAISFDSFNLTCPSEGPVQCVYGSETVGCCPAGQFCYGSYDSKYCCPTDTDCRSFMKNLAPVCANPSWDLYDMNGNKRKYFCCHKGQIGVKPKYYAPGLCLDADQNVPQTQLAIPVTQAGYTAESGDATAPSYPSNTAPVGGPTAEANDPASTATNTGNGNMDLIHMRGLTRLLLLTFNASILGCIATISAVSSIYCYI